MNNIVVIGGGIVGSSAAYRLARRGLNVTLVDRGHEGHATAAGAGIISQSAVFRQSPPSIELSAEAVRYYPDLVAQLTEDGETDTGFATVGEVFVAVNDEEANELTQVKQSLTERVKQGIHGIDEISGLTSAEAQRLFPPLAAIQSALFISGASRMDGRLMRASLQRAAQHHGMKVVNGTAQIVSDGARVSGVIVDGERIRSDQVIISGGAWSPDLAQELGFNLPVYPQRGQILHLAFQEVDTPHCPIITGYHSHYIVTFPQDRVVVGATRERDSGFDFRMTAGGVHEVLSEALRVAPGLSTATLAEIRIGFRPASPDDRPILGLAPGFENLYLATGHGPSGLQLGPYSGAAVADLLTGDPVAVNLEPFSPLRFA
jgi:D-amino-acid dehydrogenase